jgi:hypothetical protein
MRFLIITISVLALISCKSDVKNVLEVKQKMVTFSVDGESTASSSGHGMSDEWLIQGQKLTWYSKPISVRPNKNALDTIFFRGGYPKWDTIICKIQEGDSITFRYNECCGGFNAGVKPSKKSSELKIIFNLETPSNKSFLGVVGQAGILAKYGYQDTLNHGCESAMASNIKNVELLSINECKKQTNCTNSVMCFYTSTKNQADNPFSYDKKKKLLQFLYLPLRDEVLKINYNPKTDKMTVIIK